jgi:hypothetical protein
LGLSSDDALSKCRSFCERRDQRVVCIPPGDKPSTDQRYNAFKYGCVLNDSKRDDVDGLSEDVCEDTGVSKEDEKKEEEEEEESPPVEVDPRSCEAQLTRAQCTSRKSTDYKRDCVWSDEKCTEDPLNCHQYDTDQVACKSQYPCGWDRNGNGKCFNPTIYACSAELGPGGCGGRRDCVWNHASGSCMRLNDLIILVVSCALLFVVFMLIMYQRWSSGRQRQFVSHAMK